MPILSQKAKEFLLLNKNKKIVFTNGCFDILHLGHLEYLNEAKKLGDILFIGLNSDKSIKEIKGENRPINNQDFRKEMLLNLKSVDFVEVFDQPTPYELIKTISPDLLVKGGDYSLETVVGADLVKEVILIPFKEGHSTSDFIKKLQGKT
jgi:D-beta-D-heptose 7-phosphate kinase/D-beta-D-heptose 1-phosphate adenosyltransferase